MNGFCHTADKLGDFVVILSESKEGTKILLETLKTFSVTLCRRRRRHHHHHHHIALWQVHILFQSELSILCHLVLPLSLSSVFSFPFSLSRPVSAYVFFLVFIVTSIFHSITCFRSQFLRTIWPIQLAVFLFVVCRMFSSPWFFVMRTSFIHTFCVTDLLHLSAGPNFKTITFNRNIDSIRELLSSRDLSWVNKHYNCVLHLYIYS